MSTFSKNQCLLFSLLVCACVGTSRLVNNNAVSLVRLPCGAGAGGYEYDGTTEISPLQASSTAASTAELVLQAGAQAVAVCGVHAPINPSQELMFAAELAAHMQQRAPGSKHVHILLLCT